MPGDRELFSLHASEDDIRYTEAVLVRDGIIPVTDRAGHRGALQLWRNHCRSTDPSYPARLTEVRRLIALPRFRLDRATGAGGRAEQLAWVRSSDIMITAASHFPYHFSVEGLAELACSLLEEQGDPGRLGMILGNDYGVTTVEGPHRLVHQVAHNGNHRTVAIRAAGFPAVSRVAPRLVWP